MLRAAPLFYMGIKSAYIKDELTGSDPVSYMICKIFEERCNSLVEHLKVLPAHLGKSHSYNHTSQDIQRE